MPIRPTSPIEVPAKTADKLWITSLNVMSQDSAKPIRVTIAVAPCVSSNNHEVLKGLQKTIFISDLEDEAMKNPKLAMAVQAIYDAVEDIVKARQIF